MDITNFFKACVKTVRTRNKALGLGIESENNQFTPSLGILPTKKAPKSEFSRKAKEIVMSITKMRDFLVDHRKDYINMNYVMYEASTMSEAERDQIDRDALKFIQTCREIIKNLRMEEIQHQSATQVIDHQEAVIDIIKKYLRAVCNIYTEQKAIRVKRTVDKQKLVRLESGLRSSKTLKRSDTEKNGSDSETPYNERNSFNLDDSNDSSQNNMNFTPEELQLFEQENKRLYEELNNMVDEVKQIEGKVIEISRLQEVFSEKVLEQEQDINKVSVITVGTTENIKEANEELRQAMRKNAGFRLWVLFILIVLSFTILFLNWYND